MEQLAPPPTDPLVRREPPFDWYRTPTVMPHRVETPANLGDLDPDIALWRTVTVSIWPFIGAPTEGVWPVGWMGLDAAGTVWVCTVAGEPGTWTQVGSGTSGQWGGEANALFSGDGTPIFNGVTPNDPGDLYVQTPDFTAATVAADSPPPALPFTVTEGDNDTFNFTPITTAVAESFTMAPGPVADLDALTAVVAAAIGSDSSEPFSTYVTVTNDGTNLVFTMVGTNGALDNGTTLTEGDGGAAAIGIESPPNTFEGGATTPPALWQATGPTSADWQYVGAQITDIFGTGVSVNCVATAVPVSGETTLTITPNGTPPPWMNANGQIVAPGLYRFGLDLVQTTPDTTPGIYMGCQIDLPGIPLFPMPVDPLSLGEGGFTAVGAVGPGDLPFTPNWTLTPTANDDDGALSATPSVTLLATAGAF